MLQSVALHVGQTHVQHSDNQVILFPGSLRTNKAARASETFPPREVFTDSAYKNFIFLTTVGCILAC